MNGPASVLFDSRHRQQHWHEGKETRAYLIRRVFYLACFLAINRYADGSQVAVLSCSANLYVPVLSFSAAVDLF